MLHVKAVGWSWKFKIELKLLLQSVRWTELLAKRENFGTWDDNGDSATHKDLDRFP